jgi:hypothetical protein
MTIQENSEENWNKRKEELKQRFLLITNKYSMFEVNEQSEVSEKLKLRFAKTKEELDKIIASL